MRTGKNMRGKQMEGFQKADFNKKLIGIFFRMKGMPDLVQALQQGLFPCGICVYKVLLLCGIGMQGSFLRRRIRLQETLPGYGSRMEDKAVGSAG